jgi:tetratricopeptide (TPR) repeat protein
MLYLGTARHDDAHAAYTAAVELYGGLSATVGEVQARFNIADILYQRGAMDQAEAICRQCSDLAKAGGLPFRHATFENAVAVMRHYAGDLDRALEHYERARTGMGDMRNGSAVYIRSNIGGVHELRGDAASAKAAYQDAIDFAGDDPRLRGARTMAKSNLGAILADLGEKQAAIMLLSETIEEFRAAGETNDEARVLGILAYQYLGLRRYSVAEPLIQRGLALCRQRGNPACLSGMNSSLGLVARAQGRPDEAERSLRLSLEQAEAVKAPYRIFLTSRYLSDLLLAQGKAEEALALLDASDAKWNVETMSDMARRSTLQRGRALLLLGRSDEARRVFETVIGEGATEGLNNATSSSAQLELVRLDARQDAWAAVETRAAAEVERIAKMRQDFLDSVTRAEFLATQQEIFQLLIRARLARHRAGDATAMSAAFEIEERSRSRALLDALADADATRLPANAERAAARDALRIKSTALDRATARATQADVAKLDTLRSEVALARVALEAIEARDLGLRRGRELGQVRSLDVTRAMLGPDDALLMFHLRDASAWMWVVRPEAARVVDLPDATVVAPRVLRYVQDIRDGGRDANGDGRWLHDTLIQAGDCPIA